MDETSFVAVAVQSRETQHSSFFDSRIMKFVNTAVFTCDDDVDNLDKVEVHAFNI